MNMTNNITNPHDFVYLIPKIGFEFNTANNKFGIRTSSSCILLFAYNYNWENRRGINLVLETISYLGKVVYVRIRNIHQHQIDKVMIVADNTYDSIKNEKRRKWQ